MWFWDSTGEANLWLQSISGDPRWMLPITFSGNELFYLLLVPFVYFAVERRAGLTTFYALLLSHFINMFLKLVFHEPRPFWVSVMNVYVYDDTFGMPSGHAQNAVVIWGYLVIFLVRNGRIARSPGTLLACLWIFMIGVSRIFLGVHFVQDTLIGWLLGAILLLLIVRYESFVHSFYIERSVFGRFFLMASIAILVLEVGALAASINISYELLSWNETARLSVASTPHSYIKFAELQPLKLNSFLNVAGCLLGSFAALSFRYPGFEIPALFRHRLLILLPGLILIFLVYLTLSSIFPQEGIEGALLRMLRYGLVVFTGLYLYPLIVVQVRRRTLQL